MSQISKQFARAVGYAWRRYAPLEAFLPESEADDLRIIREVQDFTMTSPERIHGLITAVRYIVNSNIWGDIVECGVWKGGSMMAIAKILLLLNSKDRHLFLFDTFAGMTAPTEKDG